MPEERSEKLKDFWWSVKHSRSAKITLLVIALLLSISIVLFGILSYYGKLPWSTQSSPHSDTATTQTDGGANTVVVTGESPRRLDGVTVASAVSNRFPVAVMVENLVDIRPQAGLASAGVVYEALVEGGITRFLAIYSSDEPIERIGPIRSARLYFVDWAEEYGGIYAYVGGSPQALGATATSLTLTDLNQFYHSEYYERDEAIQAPHNLFSSNSLFTMALRDLNLLDTAGNYESYTFKDSAPATATGSAPISIDYSNEDYTVEWRYDAATNSYQRWNGGKPHLDANSSKQIQASNVLVQRVQTTLLEEATGRLAMDTTGGGVAYLFQDGITKIGTWKKTSGGRTEFVDNSGEVWQYNPGSTWIQIVTTDTAVSF